MMIEPTKSFLHHVAEDILHKHGTDLSHTTVVFPNKRASIFLNECLINIAGRPIWSPRYHTISDLFRSQSSLEVADDIKLVCDLYQSYIKCTQSIETLDKFLGWGVVLLNDFNDIDKSKANAHGLLSNLRDIHSFDTVGYLTEAQKEVLQRYFKDFDDNQESKLREKFHNLWCRFSAIYDDYNQRLRSQGLIYEGDLYREVTEKEELELDSDTYIFVGFNALQKVEKELFQKIKRQSNAYFYWDFDKYYADAASATIKEAGTFIPEMLTLFPNELDKDDEAIYNNLCHQKRIEFIGSPTGNMQARYAYTWLQEKERVDAGNRSAIVMCDESLLPTLLHSITPEVEFLNVTTGFPLSQATITSLVRRLLELSHYGVNGDKYRLKFIAPILRHPYAHLISEESTNLLKTLNVNHRNFPKREELTLDVGLSMLFRDLNDLTPAAGTQSLDRNQVVGRWIADILKRIAIKSRQLNSEAIDNTHEPTKDGNTSSDPLFEESTFRMYTLINRVNGLMDSGDLHIDFITYQRLLLQLIDMVKVPFHGEPARGLQIMGVLETRNLDFDHLLLLSCNDSNMPRGAEDSSFIPYSLREAFGLPTSDHKAAIYAYYFYRLLQRASDVTIMYRNTADEKQTGEMSRFMLQLLIESGHTIVRKNLIAGHTPTIREPKAIIKTPEVMQRLNSMSYLSPTAINRYIKCPLIFFYNYVAGIKEPDPEEDEIDYRTFGTIYHNASEIIYETITGISHDIPKDQRFLRQGVRVERKQIENILQTKGTLELIVDQVFMNDFFKGNIQKDKPEYNGLQLINREVILLYLRQMLKVDMQLAPFIIRGMEGKVSTTMTINTSQGKRHVVIGGIIDRMDEIDIDNNNHCIRVVDYKTGHTSPVKMNSMDDIFSHEKINGHSDNYLQAMLYSMIVSCSKDINPHGLPVSPALLFIQRTGAKEYNPILKIGSEQISDMSKWNDSFNSHLRSIITQMMEPSSNFEPTKDKATCKTCTYKHLCGQSNHEEYRNET